MKGRVAVLVLILCAMTLLGVQTHADTTASSTANADIQAQIDAHNKKISDLDSEIAQYQKQLNSVTAQKQSLQTAIKSIDVSKAKTSAQIDQTQNKISSANLTLDKLGNQITSKEQNIADDQQVIAASLREISRIDAISPVATLLVSDTLTDAWKIADNLVLFNESLQSHIDSLGQDKVELQGQQQQVGDTKNQLTELNSNLTTQKGQLEATEQAKQQLLTQTKNTETNYQQVIAQKKAEQKQFESELSSLESSLKSVTTSQIPHAGQGILAWPFSDSVMNNCKTKTGALGNPFCITQYFGNTDFSTANPSVYNGMGHNGLDIGVPIGTPVEAALSGVVLGTGNTDLVTGCYSFGKWVMVKHANGLDTLYAHLSQISVSKGQAVSTGDVVGYSGMTGYATGPHLHFGVYAAAGVQIMTLKQYRGATTPCANATMPVSPTNGYLNPLSYL